VAGVADRIRKILDEHGWSERELARRAGFATPSQLNGILRNLARDEGAVERATLKRIADGAGVSERWLLLGEGSPADDETARGPTSRESVRPHLLNALGFDDALAEAKRREPKIRPHAWEAVAGSSRYILRGIVTADDVIKLARVAEELADPARIEAALEAQTARVRELEAQMARDLAERKTAAARRAARKGPRGR
jgi:transcriptional regulator with XRE-family HTH domain